MIVFFRNPTETPLTPLLVFLPADKVHVELRELACTSAQTEEALPTSSSFPLSMLLPLSLNQHTS